jgi:D-glycero-alpha-D-manno-heptose-7-phosphate kinase
MIVSRTPLRISFAGGGSDLPVFYRGEPGAVLSTTIDKFVYVNVNRKFDDGIRIAYSRTEEVAAIAQVEHPLVRAALELLEIKGGVEITTIADIPSKGTGLGSSSAFTVGLLHALSAFKGRHMSREQLGADSSKVEIEMCREPIGKQDQYAAAFGGLNLIEFRPDESVVVSPVVCAASTVQRLQQHILLFYSGITRAAPPLLRQLSADIGADRAKQRTLARMVRLAHEMREQLQNDDLERFGEALHEGWMLKRSMSADISNAAIDAWYDAARRAGAAGGKILGAGAGGFLMMYAPPERHGRIRAALGGVRCVPVGFEPLGSRIIFYDYERKA